MKKQITLDQAIELVSDYATPSDFHAENWEQVREEAQMHVDGVAVALEIDDEYDIV